MRADLGVAAAEIGIVPTPLRCSGGLKQPDDAGWPADDPVLTLVMRLRAGKWDPQVLDSVAFYVLSDARFSHLNAAADINQGLSGNSN